MVFVCFLKKKIISHKMPMYSILLSAVSPLPPPPHPTPPPPKKKEGEEKEEIRYYNVPVDSMVKPLSLVLIVPPSSTSSPPPPPPPFPLHFLFTRTTSHKVQMEMINTINIRSVFKVLSGVFLKILKWSLTFATVRCQIWIARIYFIIYLFVRVDIGVSVLSQPRVETQKELIILSSIICLYFRNVALFFYLSPPPPPPPPPVSPPLFLYTCVIFYWVKHFNKVNCTDFDVDFLNIFYCGLVKCLRLCLSVSLCLCFSLSVFVCLCLSVRACARVCMCVWERQTDRHGMLAYNYSTSLYFLSNFRQQMEDASLSIPTSLSFPIDVFPHESHCEYCIFHLN